MNRIASWFAPTWAVGVAVYLLLGPAHTSWGSTIAPERAPLSATTLGSTSALAAMGPRAVLLLFVPAVLAAAPLVARRSGARRTLAAIAAAMVGAFVLVGAGTVGLLFLPTAVALVLEASGREPVSRRPA